MMDVELRKKNNQASELIKNGEFDKAKLLLKEIIEESPTYPLPYLNLGNLSRSQGKLMEAIGFYQKCISLDKTEIRAVINLGNTFYDLGLFIRAEEAYVYALQCDPNSISALVNLLLVRTVRNNQFTLCVYLLQNYESLNDEVKINALTAAISLGIEVNRCLSELRSLVINHPLAHNISAYLFSLNYDTSLSPEEWFDEYTYFAQLGPFKESEVSISDYSEHCRDGSSKIRLGLVSSDFRNHVVSRYLTNLLTALDDSQFDLYCFTNTLIRDEYTKQLEQRCYRFVYINNLSPIEQAKLIKQCDIDFLIDLAGHTRGNTLELLSKKPAKLQATWIGFGSTTGLKAIDYYIGDPISTPPDTEHLFSEKIIRIEAKIPYKAPFKLDQQLKKRKRSGIHYGSLVRVIRINDLVLKAWIEILHKTKDKNSKLILDQKAFKDPEYRNYFLTKFNLLGGDINQIELRSTELDYWNTYLDIDIALDTFPHNGGATTDEALACGVPIITLCGKRPFERLGAANLLPLRLDFLVTYSITEYVERAVALALDSQMLDWVRKTISDSYETLNTESQYSSLLLQQIKSLVNEKRKNFSDRY